MRKWFKASNIRSLSTIVAVLLALPLSWKGFTGIYTWLSPYIMLNSILVLRSFVWLNALAFIILVLSFFRKRWFCRYLCPVGWGCDKVSSVSYRKVGSYKRLPNIGKWLAIISLASAAAGFSLFIILDPMAIFNGFTSAFSGTITFATIVSLSGLPLLLAIHLILPGIWCKKLCPLGGLQLVMREIRILIYSLYPRQHKNSRQADTVRRLVLASGIGLLTGLLIPETLKAEKKHIRPPAALHPDLYNTLCIRCGSCIKVCPTKIIRHHTGADNLLAWMTPEVVFEKGYCLETCNLCSKVCPSGAINLFSVAAKKDIYMARAEIHLEDCLLTNNTECDRCKVSCKYDALDIVPVKQTILMKPVIISENCVGCGACAVICPVLTIEMKPV